jgi:hypothetical protein
LSKIAVDGDIPGLGDTVNDLVAAVANGTAALPEDGAVFTPLETADGTQFDADDAPVTDPNVGTTFTLTNALGENVMGTNANDTFNGVFETGATTNSTVNIGDTIDGGLGMDTLNILGTGAGAALPGGFATKNVEKIFITNGGAIANVDATTMVGAEQIWLVNNATSVAVNGLTATQTVGVKGDTGATTVTGNFGAGTVANLALDGAKGTAALTSTDTSDKGTLNVSGSSLVTAGVAQTVTINGTAVANSSALNVTAADKLKVDITAGTEVLTTKVMGAGNADLGTLGAKNKTLDASGNTGGVTATGVAATQEVTGGSGKDAFTAGGNLNDKGFINTGAEADTVDLAANNVASGAKVDLGEGDDSIIGTGAIDKGSTIDGGAGTDTLGLQLVGATNIGAFANFERFDVKGLNKTLDLDILASKNTVTEIIGSGAAAGASTLTNLGDGVGFRATSEMGTNDITLTQKTAGALTVTLDADTTGTAENDDSTDVVATNATSLKAVFDTASVFVQTAANKNDQNIDLTGTKATTLEIVSGGTNATNQLDYTGGDDATGGKGDLLTKVTITGDQALTFNHTVVDATEVTEIDASAHTGGLTTSLVGVKATGTVKLGSGDDVITAQAGAANDAAAIAAHIKLSGLEKGTAEDLTTATGHDSIIITGGIQAADDVAGTANASVVNGLITFKGAGPATLTEAVAFAQALIDVNEVAVFEYVGKSYIYSEGGTDGDGTDVVIELDQVGLQGIDTSAANTLYVF